jgi:hypothetical protein
MRRACWDNGNRVDILGSSSQAASYRWKSVSRPVCPRLWALPGASARRRLTGET